ncbi:MAG: hypothetical protein RIB98_13925 [Acidimicrobiales bacterium]
MAFEKVRLLDHADLQLHRHDQRDEREHTHDVRHHQRQSECGDPHRNEDRISADPERSLDHEIGPLGRVDTDAPR